MGINIYLTIYKNSEFKDQFNEINKEISNEVYQYLQDHPELEEAVDNLSLRFSVEQKIGQISSFPKISYTLSDTKRKTITEFIVDLWKTISSSYLKGEVILVDCSEIWDEGYPAYLYNGEFEFNYRQADFILLYVKLVLMNYNEPFQYVSRARDLVDEKKLDMISSTPPRYIDIEQLTEDYFGNKGKKAKNLLDKIKQNHKKIIIWGEGGVGKKSLLKRYLNGRFDPESWLTRGVDHFVKEYHFGERKFWFAFWVLGGQDRWRFFQEDFCRGADACLFIFDLTRPRTLQNVNEFLRILRSWNESLPILLIGAKGDLEKSIGFEQFRINYLDKEMGFYEHVETSAIWGLNIDYVFDVLLEMIFKNS